MIKQIFKYDTIEINGFDYIISSQFKGDDRYPDPSAHEYPEAFIKDLFDENGKLRWVIDRENPLRIYEMPQALTLEEEDAKKKKEKQNNISRLFSHDDELKLLNSAIIALSEGKPLPDEYKEYRKTVDEIIAKPSKVRSKA